MRFLLAALLTLQVASCSFLPPPKVAPVRGGLVSVGANGFGDCSQFFVDGVPPTVPHLLFQRELCFDQFAVLHSGETRTPIFVAERLNRASIQEAQTQSHHSATSFVFRTFWTLLHQHAVMTLVPIRGLEDAVLHSAGHRDLLGEMNRPDFD